MLVQRAGHSKILNVASTFMGGGILVLQPVWSFWPRSGYGAFEIEDFGWSLAGYCGIVSLTILVASGSYLIADVKLERRRMRARAAEAANQTPPNYPDPSNPADSTGADVRKARRTKNDLIWKRLRTLAAVGASIGFVLANSATCSRAVAGTLTQRIVRDSSPSLTCLIKIRRLFTFYISLAKEKDASADASMTNLDEVVAPVCQTLKTVPSSGQLGVDPKEVQHKLHAVQTIGQQMNTLSLYYGKKQVAVDLELAFSELTEQMLLCNERQNYYPPTVEGAIGQLQVNAQRDFIKRAPHLIRSGNEAACTPAATNYAFVRRFFNSDTGNDALDLELILAQELREGGKDTLGVVGPFIHAFDRHIHKADINRSNQGQAVRIVEAIGPIVAYPRRGDAPGQDTPAAILKLLKKWRQWAKERGLKDLYAATARQLWQVRDIPVQQERPTVMTLDSYLTSVGEILDIIRAHRYSWELFGECHTTQEYNIVGGYQRLARDRARELWQQMGTPPSTPLCKKLQRALTEYFDAANHALDLLPQNEGKAYRDAQKRAKRAVDHCNELKDELEAARTRAANPTPTPSP